MKKIVAKFAIGQSIKDGIGAICIEHDTEKEADAFKVFAIGGCVPPYGDDDEICQSFAEALSFAFSLIEQAAEELALD